VNYGSVPRRANLKAVHGSLNTKINIQSRGVSQIEKSEIMDENHSENEKYRKLKE
jgi:hypothetical protein